MKLHLPPQGSLTAVGDDDPLRYYYHPFVGWLYRQRLQVALRLLQSRGGRCLDLGCGSGVLLPSLALGFDEVHGLDLHDRLDRARDRLSAMSVAAALQQGSVYELPFRDDTFDAVVAISMLEHLHDLPSAFTEIARVLKPTGEAVFGFPARGRMMSLLFRLIGFWNIEEHHVAGPREILGATSQLLHHQQQQVFPGWLTGPLQLYFWVRATQQNAI